MKGIDLVCVILAMALGGCVTVLGQKIIAGMGGMPMLRKESYKDIMEKLEIAEVVITEQPLAVQKDYLESLDTWQLFSSEVYDNVKYQEAKITDLETAKVKTA